VAFLRRTAAREWAPRPSASSPAASPPNPAWVERGKRHYDHLRDLGLLKQHRLLEIGCGDLEMGWRSIRFLDPGAYTGIDISPEALLAANDNVYDLNLQQLEPRLALVAALRLDELPANHFDVVDAPSLLRRLPLDVIDELLRGVRRVLRRDGFFVVTFNEAEGEPWDVLGLQFHHPAEAITALASERGFITERLTDWPLGGTRLCLRPEPRSA
jgi:ubiquinone/menaquinone biosynthesis C-methylase UbiE